MKKAVIALLATFLALVITLPGLAETPASQYEIEEFNYPGSVWTNLWDINDAGQIVGVYSTGGLPQSFVYADGEFAPVEVPGAFYTIALGNNDRGDIVGWYVTPEYDNYGFVLDRHGNVTTLEVPGAVWTDAADINDWGKVVGQYYDGEKQIGFFYQNGMYVYPIEILSFKPDRPPGSTGLHGINNRGHVAGYVTDYSTYSEALIMNWRGINWVETSIPAPEDRDPGEGFFDLNERGQAVWAVIVDAGDGRTYTGWLWKGGEEIFFDNIPDAVNSWVTGINNDGEMVGYFGNTSGFGRGVRITPP